MADDITSQSPARPTCTAFVGHRKVAGGTYAQVDQSLRALGPHVQGLLVFDDASGAQVDHPWPTGVGQALGGETPSGEGAQTTANTQGVGRPRLGVVAREVTLLPRHWEWLSGQRGGASATLRRLVDEARRAQAGLDGQRQAKERSYRFMSAIAGGLPGFEEASRALFAHDAQAFALRTSHWPPDVSAHLAWLARDAFGPTPPASASMD